MLMPRFEHRLGQTAEQNEVRVHCSCTVATLFQCAKQTNAITAISNSYDRQQQGALSGQGGTATVYFCLAAACSVCSNSTGISTLLCTVVVVVVAAPLLVLEASP
jgi:hypothetical protein